MPQLFHFMLTRRPPDLINYQNDIRLLKFHAAPMREPSIPALPFQGVALGVGLPRKNCYLRMIDPSKGPCHRRLVAASYANGVVRLRRAEPIAPLLLPHIGACSRIDQDF